MMSENVLSFKTMLEKEIPNVKIELVDERLSSVTANNTLSELNVSHEQRKEKVDTLAACTILDTYVRRKNNGGN